MRRKIVAVVDLAKLFLLSTETEQFRQLCAQFGLWSAADCNWLVLPAANSTAALAMTTLITDGIHNQILTQTLTLNFKLSLSGNEL